MYIVMKKLGIIGGLGPMATVYFAELVVGMSDVSCDQEHIPMEIKSIPAAPDRTAYILDHTRENPLPYLVEAGRGLKQQGADYLAIPCVTAHYFQEELTQQIGLPILSLPDELTKIFQSQKIQTVGIMATSGTIESSFLQRQLLQNGIRSVVPDEEYQRQVMTIIYDQIKAGITPDIECFLEIGRHLKEKGAKKLLLGCTELSLLKRDFSDRISEDYVDSLEALARAAISYNGLSFRDYRRNGNEEE